MDERRINPKTGVIEENIGVRGENWQPVLNENDQQERVNPKTGVIEENIGVRGENWQPKRQR